MRHRVVNLVRARSVGFSVWMMAAVAMVHAGPMNKTAHSSPEVSHPVRYNFPPPSRGDRFARSGLNLAQGLRGWQRYGKVIKSIASTHRVDPFVIGAYVWLESGFDPNQDYRRGRLRALGLGSVQAGDYPQYRVGQLLEPTLNLKLTAKEFSNSWQPADMTGTVMDVWYPAWRTHARHGWVLPVVRTPQVYVQAIANRFYALKEIDKRLRTPHERATTTDMLKSKSAARHIGSTSLHDTRNQRLALSTVRQCIASSRD